jgi:hypothetical protein
MRSGTIAFIIKKMDFIKVFKYFRLFQLLSLVLANFPYPVCKNQCNFGKMMIDLKETMDYIFIFHPKISIIFNDGR